MRTARTRFLMNRRKMKRAEPFQNLPRIRLHDRRTQDAAAGTLQRCLEQGILAPSGITKPAGRGQDLFLQTGQIAPALPAEARRDGGR